MLRGWKKMTAVSFVLVPLLLNNGLVHAADTAGGSVNVRLKVGQESVTINGAASTIEKPYVVGGTTMIPLSIITNAFGATLQWDNQTQTIELTAGEKTISLKAGDKNAKLNGQPIVLSVAPELKNGKTMVPVTLVTQFLGANVSENKQTGEVTITGASTQGTAASNSSLDSDHGKTKVGDSYYGWSMKYPTELILGYQSYKGNYASFHDSKETFWLNVQVYEDQPENLSNDGLVKFLAENQYGMILSKEYVEKDGLSYARVVSRDEEDYMAESRAYRKGDKVYEITLSVSNEADFNNPAKYKGYKDMLDSFTAHFDKQDKSIKDLSNVENGYRWFDYKDFGLKIKVPAVWEKVGGDSGAAFSNDDGDQWMQLSVTSATENDKLDDWVAKHERMYREMYAESALDVDKNATTTTIAGVTARERNYGTFDGENKYQERHIFFIKGKYKFHLQLAFNKTADPAKTLEMINTISRSLSIDEQKMNQSLGFIQDDILLDKNKMATIKDSKYKYAIDIPEYWQEDVVDSRSLIGKSYLFEGGAFTLFVFKDSYSEVEKSFTSIFKMQTSGSEKTSLVENKPVTVHGESGRKFVIKGEEEGIRYERTAYLFPKGKYSYYISWSIRDAYSTAATKERMEKVLNSFKVIE
ncbi:MULTISPECIES: copper amine oxidase N-terminal domain-containing protein [Brevibacillus]|uniref:copper amine oxidase N-terminal domain-containing protein n=1 Tax=Brevibacillus TaxID=55080 RepID=UPI00156AB756|nr:MULTISPECIES: copper amine oxidase N-terminal domain-containing protein [Brevibacillus]MBU8710892.1 copper amine oxidase N-terminal domain-containing protein [Brevibacillus parabrevis]MDR5002165.1 copper amine oxidase N-terminal domain-containing protein [Brevibacillus parabrevis]NRQ55390.1 copper amine oxidase N-terminal domain-containing protein [Brevibacillus sp. HD1.4A]UED71800.1 copper amine oxidase N-terminal domain-containing protein [Brevibacillus sp. HD3.3A]